MSVNYGFGENCQKCEIWNRSKCCDVVLRVLFLESRNKIQTFYNFVSHLDQNGIMYTIMG